MTSDEQRDEARRRVNREIAYQLVELGGYLLVLALISPASRLQLKIAWLRVKQSLARPMPRLPTPWEITALHDEARRITREAT